MDTFVGCLEDIDFALADTGQDTVQVHSQVDIVLVDQRDLLDERKKEREEHGEKSLCAIEFKRFENSKKRSCNFKKINLVYGMELLCVLPFYKFVVVFW